MITRKVGGSFSSPRSTVGTGVPFIWRLWLWLPLPLPHAGAQPPLPIASKVPTRMPTADSFVGMPFMRPTLSKHCPSLLQRHTITGGKQEKTAKAAGTQGVLSSFSELPA